jgi:hypothetical protein
MLVEDGKGKSLVMMSGANFRMDWNRNRCPVIVLRMVGVSSLFQQL